MKGTFILSHHLLYRVWVNSKRQCQQGWGIRRHWGELVRILIYSSERLQPGLLRLPSEESGNPERAINTFYLIRPCTVTAVDAGRTERRTAVGVFQNVSGRNSSEIN